MDDFPSVSVIIPVFNDPEGLRMTLHSVLNQTYDPYEIIVIDNGSNDETLPVAQKYAEAHPDLLSIYIEDEIQSSYAARNRGIRNSDGDILAFIDADMTVDSTWIEKAVESMDEMNARYLACNVEIYSVSDTPSIAERYDIATGFPIEHYVKEDHFGGAGNIFVEREVFDEVGLFDSETVSGGDTEFGNRVHSSGIELHFESDIRMCHPARTSMRSLIGKARRVGRGAAQRWRNHPEKTASPFHPRNFLPTPPSQFVRWIGNNDGLSRREILFYYALNYALKLVRSTASVIETVRGANTTRT